MGYVPDHPVTAREPLRRAGVGGVSAAVAVAIFVTAGYAADRAIGLAGGPAVGVLLLSLLPALFGLVYGGLTGERRLALAFFAAGLLVLAPIHVFTVAGEGNYFLLPVFLVGWLLCAVAAVGIVVVVPSGNTPTFLAGLGSGFAAILLAFTFAPDGVLTALDAIEPAPGRIGGIVAVGVLYVVFGSYYGLVHGIALAKDG